MPLQFPKPINFSAPSALNDFQRVVSDNGMGLHFNHERVEKSFRFWKKNYPTSWQLAIDLNGVVPVRVLGHVVSYTSFDKVLSAGAHGFDMEACRGFSKVIRELLQRENFTPTLFMIEAAALCFHEPYVTDFEFEPEVEDKRADFRFRTPLFPVTGECKDMHSADNTIHRRMAEFSRKVGELLPPMPPNLRPEIYWEKIPYHYERNLAEQLAAAFGVLVERGCTTPFKLNFETSESISIVLCDRTLKPYFHGSHFMAIPRDPTQTRDESIRDTAVLISCQEDESKRIGHRIDAARRQLPANEWGMIFIQPPDGRSCDQAIIERLHQPQFSNTLGMAYLDSHQNWTFHFQPKNWPFMATVFENIRIASAPPVMNVTGSTLNLSSFPK